MTFVYILIAWVVGIIASSFLLVPPIIILAFGIPFTYEMKQAGVLTSIAPASRYTVSLVLLLALFVLASWAIWHFFPRYIWGYIVGVVLTLFPNLAKCGRTEANVSEFFQTNAQYVNQDAMRRYLGR